MQLFNSNKAPGELINNKKIVKYTLKIGTNNDVFISCAAKQMFASLSAQGINCELVSIQTLPETNIENIFYAAIIANTIDTAPIELSSLPASTGDEEVIVTAISGRSDEGEGILIRKNKTGSDNDFRIESGLVVGVKTERQYRQLQHLFPDHVFSLMDETIITGETITIPDHLDGVVLSKYIYQQHPNFKDDFKFINLHPKEIIPPPGHNIVGYLSHREDINTRKILNLIHQKSMVQISNTERMVLKMAGSEFKDTLGVFCQSDQRGYFHVNAVRCDQFRKVSLSQSISSGLAEKIYQSLFS